MNSHTDFQEMVLHVEHVKDVTGLHKSQTLLLKVDVLPDQDQAANALRDTEIKDTPVLIAHTVRLEVEQTKKNALIPNHAQVTTKFN